MEHVLLVIHLIITLALIVTILLQRAEGGGLVNASGGLGNFASAQSAGNVMTKATTILAALFFASNLLLAIVAKDHAGTSDILQAIEQEEAKPAVPPVDSGTETSAPVTPVAPSAPQSQPSAPVAD
ncbi:MAG: preprotein translocase subunit SecG [Pseudomonadota bacterium]